MKGKNIEEAMDNLVGSSQLAQAYLEPMKEAAAVVEGMDCMDVKVCRNSLNYLNWLAFVL